MCGKRCSSVDSDLVLHYLQRPNFPITLGYLGTQCVFGIGEGDGGIRVGWSCA